MDHVLTLSAAGLVAPHPLAAAAGRDVLVEGGTVLEAALAAAMVAAVVVPQRNGLGGDGLWLLREAGPRGRVRVLDARGETGRLARAAYLQDRGHEAVPRQGPEAVLAAPGAVAGWAEAADLARALGGRLPRGRLLAPAIAAAQEHSEPTQGVPHEPTEAARIGLSGSAPPGGMPPDAMPPAPDAPQRPPRLADTLDHLARAGFADLYRGDVARELAADLASLVCPLGCDDLRATAARWRPPATLDFGRETLATAALQAPLAAVVALGLWRALGGAAPDGFGGIHALLEGLKLAPGLVAAAVRTKGGLDRLLDRAALDRAALRIDGRRVAPSPPGVPPFDEAGIVIGAVDRDGAAVALVQFIGSLGGSGLVSGRTGILLGNRAAALPLDDASGAGLAPGRRVPMLSVPLLVSDTRGRVVSLAATGPHAEALVAQLAAGLDAGSLEPLATRPRVAPGSARDGSGAVLIEADREPEPAARLRGAGHELVSVPAGALRTAGIVARQASGRIEALADGDAAADGL